MRNMRQNVEEFGFLQEAHHNHPFGQSEFSMSRLRQDMQELAIFACPFADAYGKREALQMLLL